MPQYLLINEVWVTKIFIIVVLTSFSVYFTYLLPLNYLNLLQKAAFHLGRWEEIEKSHAKDFVPFSDEILYPASEKVTISFNDKFYKVADSKNAISTVAIPGNNAQFLFFVSFCFECLHLYCFSEDSKRSSEIRNIFVYL